MAGRQYRAKSARRAIGRSDHATLDRIDPRIFGLFPATFAIRYVFFRGNHPKYQSKRRFFALYDGVPRNVSVAGIDEPPKTALTLQNVWLAPMDTSHLAEHAGAAGS